MWRLRHEDGRVAHAVILPQGVKACAAWFILEHPEQGRNFESWHDAITWVEHVRLMLLSAGWYPRRQPGF